MTQYYLTGVKISQGMFPDESTVEIENYLGKVYSGLFHEAGIGLDALLVEVWRIKDGLAVAIPLSGQFHQSSGIVVEESRLRTERF
jgi:hypothetical protein